MLEGSTEPPEPADDIPDDPVEVLNTGEGVGIEIDDHGTEKVKSHCNRQFDFGYRQSAVHRWLSAFLAKGAVPKTLLINTCNMVAEYLGIPLLTRREMRSALERSKWLETYGKQVVQVLSRNREMQNCVLMMMFKGTKYKPPSYAFIRRDLAVSGGSLLPEVITREETSPPQGSFQPRASELPSPQVNPVVIPIERYQRHLSAPTMLPPPPQVPDDSTLGAQARVVPDLVRDISSQIPPGKTMGISTQERFGTVPPKLVPIGLEFACDIIFRPRAS